MPTQALCCFLKRQASTQVADLALHPARRPLLLDSPHGIIGGFTMRTALICFGDPQALVIRAPERYWPHQSKQLLGPFSYQPLAMSATPLAPGYRALLTEPTVQDSFQQATSHLLARCDDLLFQVLQVSFAQVLHVREKLFQSLLDRCSHCLFHLLIRFHLGRLLSGLLFYR